MDIPTGDQVKTTIDAWNELVAAAQHFLMVSAWVVPTVMGIAAHVSAWVDGANKIWLIRLLAGNYGHAKNED